MELMIMNTSFVRIGAVVDFSSVIWHKLYYDAGDFEIYINASKENVDMLKKDYYIVREDDDSVGIIESIEIKYDETNEVDMMTVKGRFSESIYERRIVWTQTTINTKLELGLRSIINQNFINPEIANRKINAIGLGTLKNFSETLNSQYTGDNVLTVIKESLISAYIGFKNIFNGSKFNFTLYKGVDRSKDQNVNPHVIFSDEYDNLLSSVYINNKTNYKNTALVAGEGEGLERKTQYINNSNVGLNRYELFVDAKGVSSNGEEISTSDYNSLLIAKGKESLSEHFISEVFEGEIDLNDRYEYKTDVDLGDLVSIENRKWGLYTNSRIIGVIESENENGHSIIFEFGI